MAVEIVSLPSDVDYTSQIQSASPTDLPLIMTSKGNIPVDALRYETEWVTESHYIMFSERWYLGEELVKSNSHAYTSNPLGQIGSEQQSF